MREVRSTPISWSISHRRASPIQDGADNASNFSRVKRSRSSCRFVATRFSSARCTCERAFIVSCLILFRRSPQVVQSFSFSSAVSLFSIFLRPLSVFSTSPSLTSSLPQLALPIFIEESTDGASLLPVLHKSSTQPARDDPSASVCLTSPTKGRMAQSRLRPPFTFVSLESPGVSESLLSLSLSPSLGKKPYADRISKSHARCSRVLPSKPTRLLPLP
mmetsp:Transcript_58860/g.115510  ORF Transcript_58860/g.115510 Transcript_58860/m.115510 type:complete len:218 (-) Transcript_58860:597-1250(-)